MTGQMEDPRACVPTFVASHPKGTSHTELLVCRQHVIVFSVQFFFIMFVDVTRHRALVSGGSLALEIQY